MFRAPAQQEILLRAGRRLRDEATGGPVGPERPTQRHHFDDPGAGPSHAPPTAAGVDDDDIRRRFEMMFRDMPEGMWIRIQDEEFLE